jgi:chromosome segregation ATPase
VKRAALCCAVLLAATTLPARAQAPSAAPGPATLETLLQEVRLLRKAIEKQSVTATRTQLVMGRIALQEQRLARARDLLERVDGQLMVAERERDHLRSAAAEFARNLEEAPDEAKRAELESAVRNVRVQVTDQDKVVSEIRTRHAQAQQALEAETSRYDELDGWLRDLDRELQRPGP